MFYENFSREEEIRMNKRFLNNFRYDYYVQRFVDESLLKSGNYIKERNFFPVSTFTEIIKERVELAPTDFSITGKEKDFLKSFLLEGSGISSKMPELYLEQDLAGDAFWKIVVRASDEGELVYDMDFELLNTEDVIPIEDEFTGKLAKVINEYDLEVQNPDGSYSIRQVKETYTMDTIEIDIKSPGVKRFEKEKITSRVVPNPFKEYGVLPILWFKGFKKTDSIYSRIPATDLIEPTLQLDYLNTDTESATHRSAFPLIELRKAMKKYDRIDLGAGTVFYSRGEEELHVHGSQLNLTQLSERIEKKTNSIYKLGGLVPLSIREPMAGSSSSKMAKYASKEYIELTKTRLEGVRRELKKVLKLFLEINGKKYSDEEIAVPSDVLSIDREETIKNIAMELELGLIDDVYVWNKYYPEMTEVDRARIKKFREDKAKMEQKASESNLNIDNKVKAGKIVGNKKANEMSADDKDRATTKSK